MTKEKVIFFFTLTYLVLTATSSQSQESDDNFSDFLRGIMREERSSMQEPCDDTTSMVTFDFIIVGAGPGGCVLANRLTEVPGWEVLLLEAGGEEPAIVDIPALIGRVLTEETTWNYKSVPSEENARAFTNYKYQYPQGTIMGGSSTINYMFATRGSCQDYDNWAGMGNYGWNCTSVLPYFKKFENMLISELSTDSYHSTEGNIPISYADYQSEVGMMILDAATELGYEVGDYNGDHQAKFSRPQLTIKNGTRWSASRGYLHPIHDRSNLHVRKRAMVTKILIDPDSKVAYGVKYEKGGVEYTVFANKEVIISAGSIKSPQLLMVSGIGPADHLKEFNISVIADLPVGGLIDHTWFNGLLFTTDNSPASKPVDVIKNPKNYLDYFEKRKGPLTSVYPYEVLGFLELKNTSYYTEKWPIAEVMFVSHFTLSEKEMALGLDIREDLFEDYLKPLENKTMLQIIVVPIRPKSNGTIRLRDTDINSEPEIDPKFFSNEDDVEVALAAIKEIIKFTETKEMKKINMTLYDVPLPLCETYEFGSDDYWRCGVKQWSLGIYHPTATCKMGPVSDKSSVVDPELKVHGIQNLRVVDSAIMPMVICGHLQVPTYMIAEKGSDMIKATYGDI